MILSYCNGLHEETSVLTWPFRYESLYISLLDEARVIPVPFFKLELLLGKCLPLLAGLPHG